MDINLSKDEEYFLHFLYKTYLERRKSGISKSKANSWESIKEISLLFDKWFFEDLEDICFLLYSKNLILGITADDTIYDLSLSNDVIIYMENRFKNNSQELLDVLIKLKSSIFPL